MVGLFSTLEPSSTAIFAREFMILPRLSLANSPIGLAYRKISRDRITLPWTPVSSALYTLVTHSSDNNRGFCYKN